jgi:hypothetical protein
MRKPSLLAAIPAVLVMAAATSRCNTVDQATDTDAAVAPGAGGAEGAGLRKHRA